VWDFWKDFRNPRQFSPATDRFALVTLRGTNNLLAHFSGLLDCARDAHDEAEFERRLATPGFVNAKVSHYCNELLAIISGIEERSVSAAEIWPLLQVLHVLSLDLDSSTRQTEAAIKSLLAYTTVEQDMSGAAEASWNALLREVGGKALSYQRQDLPESVRRRHSAVGGYEQRVLRALSDHSALILDGIRSTIGNDLHLGRGRLVHQVLEKLETTQVVLVSGQAGSGKSGITKDALALLAADHFVFTFRAEEFAYPHFDETLQSNQLAANAATLGAILASQDRKVLLVESVERLLEKSTRDAFTDLLTLMARDKAWRLALTCRDYSTDLIRACFLEPMKIGHSVVTVPPLDDEELKEAEAAHPMLAPPLTNPALRRILRNPYVLDKALQIGWSEERSLPQSEREFRAHFWQEIVRAEHRTAGGMPRRREDTFVQIALRRARALTLYATCHDLDPEVIGGLRRDSLIVSFQQSDVLVAPAHDVLEDWAILQWIDERYWMHEGSVRELASEIGTHPAVRRTYRKWVTELVERDPEAADGIFRAAVPDEVLTAQFRDDTLVSLLRSRSSAAFLERHSVALFENDKQLVRQVIHLIRVACVTTPEWLGTLEAPALFNVPDGPAWACVLRLVQTHLQSFAKEDCSLLLGFIEDWSRGVTWRNPYPEGAESAAAIAHWLLPKYDSYKLEDHRKRTLQVVAKIPNADRERFADLLQENRDDEGRDHATDDFRKIIVEGLEGMPAARDMPELVVSVIKEYLLCSETDLQIEWNHGNSLDLETLFGIKEYRSHGFNPASAYHGPFLSLLRHHPRIGLDFIISALNHSADWYAHPRIEEDFVEPPFDMTLTFKDGVSRRQWCNARLWNLYRGTSKGPDVLQCLLMALERWLLEFAETQPSELDAVLLHILRRSDSAALTAVVASIATAFPYAAGETLLVMLRSPLCIQLDCYRLAYELQAPSKLHDVLPRFNTRNIIYEQERKEADSRPHRHHDLQAAIRNLQVGPLALRVYEILDRHRMELPPVEKQDENDRIWRLALHRMDLRQYIVSKETTGVPVAVGGHTSSGNGRHYVRLDLKVPEPDIMAMVDESTTQFQATNARLDDLIWGFKIFNSEQGATWDPGEWRERLYDARTSGVLDCESKYHDLGRSGPGFVAAVCVRDHWEELTGEERHWCVGVICSEVEREGDNWDQLTRVQRNPISADRPCAWVLPVLLGKPLDEPARSRVREVLVIALTHAIREVRWYAAAGIGRYLWVVDREFAIRCVNAIANEATMVQEMADAKLHGPYSEGEQGNSIEAKAAVVIRQRFFETDGISDDAHQTFDPIGWVGSEANKRILTILGRAPTEAAAIETFRRLVDMLVGWWSDDHDRRRNRNQRRRERDYETESVLTELLESFLLRTTLADASALIRPICGAVDGCPEEVSRFLKGLIGVEDRESNKLQFWSLWEMLAEEVRRAKWLGSIDREHATGKGMMSAIFLGAEWKEGVRHWRSLEGHARHVHALFEDLPATSTALHDYLRFLYHVGEQSLPEAFIRIAKRLQQGDPAQMMIKGNTVFMLETLLQRYVYGRPLELKRQGNLREAVLFLLDLLVENGSSAGFRMRDDFVTPISIN
jgi:hypothetical protein